MGVRSEYKTIVLKELVRELNPGPLAPKAKIMPLDQQADANPP